MAIACPLNISRRMLNLVNDAKNYKNIDKRLLAFKTVHREVATIFKTSSTLNEEREVTLTPS